MHVKLMYPDKVKGRNKLTTVQVTDNFLSVNAYFFTKENKKRPL